MRAMKQSTLRFLRPACGMLILLAAAPIVGAQVPSSAPGAPGPAAGGPGTAASSAPGEPPAALTGEQSGYLFGLTFGEQMRGVGITNEVAIDAITRGINDGLQGKKTTRADRQELQGFVRSVMEAAVTRNKAAAKEFLDRNARDKGVKTTLSGLQYKVIAAGDAKAAAVNPTDQVTVQYRGKLIDGSEFDSSYAHGAPAVFTVNGVIKGWQEALVLMKPGAKWQLFVPPELAYGPAPRPGIPGGSLLIFDVELVSVKPAAAVQAPAAPKSPAPSP